MNDEINSQTYSSSLFFLLPLSILYMYLLILEYHSRLIGCRFIFLSNTDGFLSELIVCSKS